MTDAQISFDTTIFEARRLLQKPMPKRVSTWRGLGAAALAAFSALTLAAAVILGPGGGGPSSGAHHDVDLSHWQP